MTVRRFCPLCVVLSRRVGLLGLLACVAVALTMPFGWTVPAQGAEKAAAQKAPAQKVPAQKVPAQKVPAQKVPAQKAPVRVAPQPPKKKLSAPIELKGNDLVASDGARLSATFYPGRGNKDTVPVILLHMSEGDRKEYLELAPYLQEQGHAVLVPDLRGHGESSQVRLTPNQYYEMPYKDMEALRRFLVDQNDEGQLNLNSLCIVGAEMGASVAVYYALYDWTTPRREASRAMPAQDIRALVLISPEWAFPGLPLKRPLTSPFIRSQIAMMIIVGRENSRALSDARGMYKLLKPYHPDKEDIKDRDLVFLDPRTKLQGTKMLGVKSLNLEKIIGRFIELRVVDQRYRWEQRGSK